MLWHGLITARWKLELQSILIKELSERGHGKSSFLGRTRDEAKNKWKSVVLSRSGRAYYSKSLRYYELQISGKEMDYTQMNVVFNRQFTLNTN